MGTKIRTCYYKVDGCAGWTLKDLLLVLALRLPFESKHFDNWKTVKVTAIDYLSNDGLSFKNWDDLMAFSKFCLETTRWDLKVLLISGPEPLPFFLEEFHFIQECEY